MAVKPVAAPGFDARAANNTWLAKIRKDDGSPYSVFETGGFQALNRWQLGIGEYDGKGLLDAVKTNADQQNKMKADLDAHGQAIADMKADIRVLQEAPAARPFP